MHFSSPLWLWALLLAPLAVLIELALVRRDRERAARLVARPLWAKIVVRPEARVRWARVALIVLGIAGMALALARPEWGIVREPVERQGVDVVLLLDTSGSMATPDVSPSRFALAKLALLGLIERLEGERFALVAFEGEAYPLVPLTLDIDAIGLFLDTLEHGVVPTPGSSLGVGLARSLEAFVDKDRPNKFVILVSDGEDLEGEIEGAVASAKEAGVVIHTVGVGTLDGAPVPSFDDAGRPVGYKRHEDGTAVVSKMNPSTLETIAAATGGRFIHVQTLDTGLQEIVAAVEGVERKDKMKDFTYRRQERYQIPLAIGLAALLLALLLPDRIRRRAAAAALFLAAATLVPNSARAEKPAAVSELLLEPKRANDAGRKEFELGNHPAALEAFERAMKARPGDSRLKFNLADGYYKTGRHEDAEKLFRELIDAPDAELARSARFNLGNALYQKQDYRGAIDAYRGVLRQQADHDDARTNLELALRALKQQEQQQQQQQEEKKDEEKKKEEQQQQQQQGGNQPPPQEQQRPKTEEEKERERFLEEAGMPKERAMQLLEALERNEQDQQKKQLAAERRKTKKKKDW